MIDQEIPEPGQADRLTEPPKVRHQDLTPVALPPPSLPGYRQIGPRADSVSRDLSVFCCLVIGGRAPRRRSAWGVPGSLSSNSTAFANQAVASGQLDA